MVEHQDVARCVPGDGTAECLDERLALLAPWKRDGHAARNDALAASAPERLDDPHRVRLHPLDDAGTQQRRDDHVDFIAGDLDAGRFIDEARVPDHGRTREHVQHVQAVARLVEELAEDPVVLGPAEAANANSDVVFG